MQHVSAGRGEGRQGEASWPGGPTAGACAGESVSAQASATPLTAAGSAAERYWILVVASLVVALGIYLRVSPRFGPTGGVGVDEQIYGRYVDFVAREGFTAYPRLVEEFIVTDPARNVKEVPPLRLTTVFSGGLIRRQFGVEPLEALRATSYLAATLALLVAGVFGWRLGGGGGGLAMLALAAVTPLQVYLAHRGLVDGVFSLFSTTCLWLAWEQLQQPRRAWPALGLGLGVAMMVATKETALFAWIALALFAALARRLRAGEPSWRLWAALALGAAGGCLALAMACGGVQVMFDVFRLDVAKPMSVYSRLHQDGPWYTLLLGSFTLSPMVSMFACAAVLEARRQDAALSLFVVASMAGLLLVPLHKIMRVACMWDVPLAWLAWSQAQAMSQRYGARSGAVAVALVILLCVSQLFQYMFFFQWNPMSDPALDLLLRCLKVVP